MSVENVSFELQNGTYPTPTTSGLPVTVMNVQDATYDKLATIVLANQALSLAAPNGTTGAGRYAPGCIGVDLTGASGDNADSYTAVNKGTAASPDFVAISLAP
jgi:hypothetical protein